MNVVFRSSPVTDPYTFESVGSGWEQDRVTRPSGYPFYHYLQTEQGSGKIKTASTMVCIILMLLPIPELLNLVCWVVILVTTVYSGIEYFIKNKHVIDWSNL